jgi:hypothetical protein
MASPAGCGSTKEESMSALYSVLGLIAGVVSLVCWIMVLIKIFKDNVILGIIGVITCGLFAFIYGWVKVKQYGIKNIMMIWTIAIVIGLIVNALGGATLFSQMMSEMPG